MITFEIKINGVQVQRVTARRIRSINEEMEKTGYDYNTVIYDFQKEKATTQIINHKRQDSAGALLKNILFNYE